MIDVSVLIPSRNEQFLVPTIRDVLAKAATSIEVVVILDGYWLDLHADLGLDASDARLKILHVGAAAGMRPALNAAVQMATGRHLMKLDAHCMLAPGFDRALIDACQDAHWVLVPRRYALDPVAWDIDTSNPKYPIDYHYLSCPMATPADSTPGLHGGEWRARRLQRADVILDDELSSQGSCWFMSREHWDTVVGPLDAAHYGSFWHEFQEVGLKTWLSGGAVKVVKSTWYAHLYKGKKWGRGFSLKDAGHEQGSAFCTWFWMTDQPFNGRQHDLAWLIRTFAPVPTWPEDIGPVFQWARETLRNPYEGDFSWRGFQSTLRPAKIATGLETLEAALTRPGRQDVSLGRDVLAQVLAARGRGAEIGVERGHYTETLLKAGASVIAVDAWEAYPGYREHVSQERLDGFYTETIARLAPYGTRAEVRRGRSVDVAATVPDGSLDWVYLDGNHTLPHVIADVAAWTPKVRSGGIIAGHDYGRSTVGHVREAVDLWVSCYQIPSWVVLTGDRSPSWAWVQP